MHILIIESESPELLASTGQSHAQEYGEELQRIDSSINILISAPNERKFSGSELSVADAVVFPGAGVSWPTHDPETIPLRDTMKAVFAQGLPCFGSCNGLRLA